MIIVDNVLQRRAEEGRPIRVAMVGCGFATRPLVPRFCGQVPGVELVAIINRRPDVALEAYRTGGVEPVRIDTVAGLEAAIAEGRPAYGDDPSTACAAGGVDVVFEVTGSYDYGASVILDAIAHGKHVLHMNAELDGTIGPWLKARADEAGVMYSQCDGDQPAVIVNLYRFVTSQGHDVKLLGNIKGLQDPHRTPVTQKGFAEKWGQKPHMVTSFADGTKVNYEMATVANATGFRAATRGLWQPVVPAGFPIEDIAQHYPVDEILAGPGYVDYCVGASPNAGVFALATNESELQRHYLNLFKLGEGPLYCFYNPFHLCHFEVENSLVRMLDFGDLPVALIGAPVVEVVAIAKTDLEAGQTLDGLGYFMTYGECENSDTARAQGLVPYGLAEGSRLRRAVPQDQPITFDDVELSGRPIDELFMEQLRHFTTAPAAS